MFGISQLERSPVTFALLVAIGLGYLAQQALPVTTIAGLLHGPSVANGQAWRLLTWGFLHGGLMHVGFNAFMLFALGPQLERAFGSARFALLYFGALFGGALLVMLFDWPQQTLGASGAVLGIAAALAIALWLRGADLRQVPAFGLVVLNLALPLLLPGISFWGHAGGILAGAGMAWLLTRQARAPASSASASLLGLGAGVTVGLAALAMLAAQMNGG